MDIDQVKPIVLKYLKKLTKDMSIDKAFIFGSLAQGKASKDSDIDVMILSKDFNKMDVDERLKILYRKSVGIPFDIHLQAVTPEELKNASPLTSLGTINKSKTIPLI